MKYIPFFFIILIIACEQLVEIDVPEQAPQIALTCFYESSDMEVKVYLNNSLGILDNQEIEPILGANVKIFENEVLMADFLPKTDTLFRYEETGEYDSLGNPIYEEIVRRTLPYYHIELSSPLEVGNTYKITAQADGFDDIAATQKFPVAPNVSNLIYKPSGFGGLGSTFSDAFQFQIEDRPDEDNYYAMQVYTCLSSSFSYCEDIWTNSLTADVAAGLDGVVLLSDNLFDGQSYDVELLSNPIDTTVNNIKVVVSALSNGGYHFSKSVEAYEIAGDNPFVEPIIIPSNVENGQGVFSMENKTEVLIE